MNDKRGNIKKGLATVNYKSGFKVVWCLYPVIVGRNFSSRITTLEEVALNRVV